MPAGTGGEEASSRVAREHEERGRRDGGKRGLDEGVEPHAAAHALGRAWGRKRRFRPRLVVWDRGAQAVANARDVLYRNGGIDREGFAQQVRLLREVARLHDSLGPELFAQGLICEDVAGALEQDEE